MINVVALIPSSLLLIKPAPSWDAHHIVTLIHFQLITIMAFTIINPILYIGSSAELRNDIDICKKHFLRNFTNVDESDSNRGEIYAMQVVM